MTTTRLSIDMSRRVPMGATRVDTEVVRDGKRIQAIEARYVVDDEIVGRATAMRVRIAEDLSVPNPVLPEDQIPMTRTPIRLSRGLRRPLDFAASSTFAEATTTVG